MEQRHKYLQSQHQPLFKASAQSSGSVAPPTPAAPAHVVGQGAPRQNSFKQYKQISDSLSSSLGGRLSNNPGNASLNAKERGPFNSVSASNGSYALTSGKHKRKYLTRAPSQTFDHDDGHSGTGVASGDNTTATGQGGTHQNGQQLIQRNQRKDGANNNGRLKFKLELQKASKKGAMTRKPSRTGTLVNSVVIPSRGEFGHSQRVSASPDIPVSSAHSMASNSNAPTLKKFNQAAGALESPSKGRQVNNRNAVLSFVNGPSPGVGQTINRKAGLFNSVVLTGLNSEMATPKVPGRGRRKSGAGYSGQYQGATDVANADPRVNTQASGDFNPMNELFPSQAPSAKSLGAAQSLTAPMRREPHRQGPAGGQAYATAEPATQRMQQPKTKKILNTQGRAIGSVGIQRRASNQQTRLSADASSSNALLLPGTLAQHSRGPPSQQNPTLHAESASQGTPGPRQLKTASQSPGKQNSLHGPRLVANSSCIESGSFSISVLQPQQKKASHPHQLQFYAQQHQPSTATPSDTNQSQLPRSPCNLTPNVSIHKNDQPKHDAWTTQQLSHQQLAPPSTSQASSAHGVPSLTQNLNAQIQAQKNASASSAGDSQQLRGYPAMAPPASYYLLHGNYHHSKASKVKSIQEPAQPGANQRLSNMMQQSFKSNSHGLTTPNTGGGSQGLKQGPALGMIKVPKQLIAQMHKANVLGGTMKTDKATPSFGKDFGASQQSAGQHHGPDNRIIGVETRTMPVSGQHSKRSTLVGQDQMLDARSQLSTHHKQNCQVDQQTGSRYRQGHSAEAQPDPLPIQTGLPSGFGTSGPKHRRGLASTQDPNQLFENHLRHSTQPVARTLEDEADGPGQSHDQPLSDRYTKKEETNRGSRFALQAAGSSGQSQKAKAGHPQASTNPRNAQISIKQLKGKQKPLSRDDVGSMIANLREGSGERVSKGHNRTPTEVKPLSQQRGRIKSPGGGVSKRKPSGKKRTAAEPIVIHQNYQATGGVKPVPSSKPKVKTMPNSSRPGAHPAQLPTQEVQTLQGQMLLNQYVANSKRSKRTNLSKEPISSLERSSQVAEKIFAPAAPHKAQPQKLNFHSGSMLSPKTQLLKQVAHPSQASLEESTGAVSTHPAVSNTHNSVPSQQSQLEIKKEAKDALLIEEYDDQYSAKKPGKIESPRTREVKLLSQVIRDCFQKHGKMPKTRIELYKVGKVLGKGAFGKVNLGMHRLTRRLVAIKSTTKDHIKEESTKRKMLQEIDVLKALRHSSHIRLLETFQTAKHYLIVMELCPGGDLLNYVRKRRKLAEKPAKYVFKQIMQGIAYMHQQGIVHRDIKLDNILLDGHGHIKIADFGVSRRVIEDELLFEQCGTPAYIAPEIVQEIGYKGFPVDIWSAGVCLYAIMYGNVPYKANQIGDLNSELYSNEIEYKDTISEQARDLMKKMLSKDVNKRLTAIEVLGHPWLNEDLDEKVNIFDEQEKNLIRKEFTYLLQKKLLEGNTDRGPDDLNTQFTEHSISAADTGLLKNSSTRSVILCPFNSRQQEVEEQERLIDGCQELMEDKDIMIRFGINCRELDRAYEKFNNVDFDNGVYHKYAYKHQGSAKKKEEGKEDEEEGKAETQVHHSLNSRIVNGRIMTPEEDKYQKVDRAIVKKVEQYGFPEATTINCLKQNMVNHCTATYYLLLLDQNF